MAVFDLNQSASSLSEEDDVAASNSHVVSISSLINTGCDSFASHDDNASSSNSLKTPKDVIHHEFIDTPGGSVYWVPRVSASVSLVLGTVYDSLDECIEMYRKYASEAVCGCKARVVFDMVPHTTKYTLTTFDVEHNHELDRVEYKHLSKAERRLTYNEQLFIIKAANANIGAVRAHNLYTGLKGSSSLVHGTQTEFKNFTRGVNCFIGDSDAQMLITRMEQRQEFTKDFSFDYFVEDAELCGLFWADEVAKCNYKEFGDIVSFDATYKTNKYKMVFMPCTAIDNYRRSVTVVITDQDGAMRLAVATDFLEYKHRLYMWHIMQKIPSKIVSRIYDDTDFKDKFGKIVWNMFIGPEEFEDRWNKLMEEFNLVNHKWLSKMYRLRSSWILAFFVDSPLCGLMRTTSRQRHTQEKLDHQSFDSFPALLTPLPIEEHASKVYTCSLFIRVQKEIVAGSWLCSITCMSSVEGCTVCIIDEEKIKPVGLPETKDLIPPDLRNKKKRYGKKNEAIEKLAMEASIILDSCVHMLRNNEPKLSVFVNQMKAIKSELKVELPTVPTRTVSDFVQEFIGVKKPDKVKVKNPTCVRPKGREKQKRIKSGREISMKKSNKKIVVVFVDLLAHNRRTCPWNNNVNVLNPAVVVPGVMLMWMVASKMVLSEVVSV
ncbi:FAR1-related sequence 5-like protein [Tanacetum coccineum]